MIVDSTVVAAIVTSLATIVAVLLTFWLNKIRPDKQDNGSNNNDITQSEPTSLSNHKYYLIISKNSGKCLNIRKATKDSVSVTQSDCSVDKDSNKWRLINKNKYYQISVKHSKKCLNVCCASTKEGERIIQWECGKNGHKNDLWKIEKQMNSKYYRIISKGSELCLCVENNSLDSGEIIIQSSCSKNNNNGLWELKPVESV